ncbi:MAG: hypothetical protein JWR19_1269 [Pedosphaera sp.]|nr:hypothetical protein [Pedosphaera sp.]
MGSVPEVSRYALNLRLLSGCFRTGHHAGAPVLLSFHTQAMRAASPQYSRLSVGATTEVLQHGSPWGSAFAKALADETAGEATRLVKVKLSSFFMRCLGGARETVVGFAVSQGYARLCFYRSRLVKVLPPTVGVRRVLAFGCCCCSIPGPCGLPARDTADCQSALRSRCFRRRQGFHRRRSYDGQDGGLAGPPWGQQGRSRYRKVIGRPVKVSEGCFLWNMVVSSLRGLESLGADPMAGAMGLLDSFVPPALGVESEPSHVLVTVQRKSLVALGMVFNVI